MNRRCWCLIPVMAAMNLFMTVSVHVYVVCALVVIICCNYYIMFNVLAEDNAQLQSCPECNIARTNKQQILVVDIVKRLQRLLKLKDYAKAFRYMYVYRFVIAYVLSVFAYVLSLFSYVLSLFTFFYCLRFVNVGTPLSDPIT